MEFLNVPVFDDDVIKLLVRLMSDLFFLFLLIGLAYYPYQKKKNYVFAFVMLNIMVFLLCFALKKIDMGMGMAMGLFALFGIIRYRTGTIRVKEMTYLFLIVGIAAINSLTNKKTSYAELFLANSLIVGGAIFLERFFCKENGSSSEVDSGTATQSNGKQEVAYDKLELLRPEMRSELILDLYTRTGLHINSVDVKKIDLRSNWFFRDFSGRFLRV